MDHTIFSCTRIAGYKILGLGSVKYYTSIIDIIVLTFKQKVKKCHLNNDLVSFMKVHCSQALDASISKIIQLFCKLTR